MQRFALRLLMVLGTLAILGVAAQRGLSTAETTNAPRRANVAGQFDYYIMVLSWCPTHCATIEPRRDDTQCGRSDGKRFGFVLHGLWPQYERGYPERCRTRWRPFVPGPVINRMLDIMPSRGLVIHEYRVHGTCSGLRPASYFALARQFFNRIRIPKRYQNPFETQFVTRRQLFADFVQANPGLQPDMIAVTCGGPGNRLRGVRICMSRHARPRSCGPNESGRTACRRERIYVPPVRSRRR